MRAESGPIGGDMSHEFIIMADTGESQVFCHADCFDYNVLEELVDYQSDLEPLVSRWTDLYAATDEQHDSSEFERSVPPDKRCEARGIEVGHIFYFGTKYSEAMGAFVSGPDGGRVTMEMGSYGIGVSRLVGAIIEANHDDDGIIWPDSVAPFRVGVVNLKPEDQKCNVLGGEVYEKLRTNGIDTLYEDREGRAGVKFANMDLIGLPWQLIIGPRGAAGGRVELKSRKTGQRDDLSMEDAIKRVIS
jgi:prolyl-tRNA synthetase